MFLHVLSALFNNLKNIDSQDVTTQMDYFNVDCALKLCNYTSLKRFIRLNKILKTFSNTTFSVLLLYIAVRSL